MDALLFVALDLAGQFQGDLDTLFLGIAGCIRGLHALQERLRHVDTRNLVHVERHLVAF